MKPKSENETEEASRPAPRVSPEELSQWLALAQEFGAQIGYTGEGVPMVGRVPYFGAAVFDLADERRKVCSLEAALAAREPVIAAAKKWREAECDCEWDAGMQHTDRCAVTRANEALQQAVDAAEPLAPEPVGGVAMGSEQP